MTILFKREREVGLQLENFAIQIPNIKSNLNFLLHLMCQNSHPNLKDLLYPAYLSKSLVMKISLSITYIVIMGKNTLLQKCLYTDWKEWGAVGL